MKKRTKIIILSCMVALLGLTAYLNVALNNQVLETGGVVTTYTSYFASYRTDRESTRDQELLYYDAMIANSATSAETIAIAEGKKLEIVANMEMELVMEGLIKSKGFEDAVVAFSENYVNVIVKSDGMQPSEVAQIVNIVQEQTGKGIANIRIIPIE